MRYTWFPLAHSSSIGQKPVRRAIYSHPYFIWRENGIAVASEFHPNERQTRDKSAYTDAHGRYPVMEHYGYVWGWPGRAAVADPAHPPSLPFIPPHGGLPGHMLVTVRFDCSESRSASVEPSGGTSVSITFVDVAFQTQTI